jgi:hypothetical protein
VNPKTVTVLGADMMVDEAMNPYLIEVDYFLTIELEIFFKNHI